jgi:hypothetical protein
MYRRRGDERHTFVLALLNEGVPGSSPGVGLRIRAIS